MSTLPPKALFRSLVRQAKTMKDYNFREYTLRRVKVGFQNNKELQG